MCLFQTIYLEQKTPSGHGNCIEETGWYYARFTAYLANPSV